MRVEYFYYIHNYYEIKSTTSRGSNCKKIKSKMATYKIKKLSPPTEDLGGSMRVECKNKKCQKLTH